MLILKPSPFLPSFRERRATINRALQASGFAAAFPLLYVASEPEPGPTPEWLSDFAAVTAVASESESCHAWPHVITLARWACDHDPDPSAAYHELLAWLARRAAPR